MSIEWRAQGEERERESETSTQKKTRDMTHVMDMVRLAHDGERETQNKNTRNYTSRERRDGGREKVREGVSEFGRQTILL